MENNNVFINIGKIIISFLWDIVYFPLWWYTKGLGNLLIGIGSFLATKERKLALFVWIKNITKPMYGERSFQGIIISFFMRLFQIIFRSIVLFFWMIAGILLICVWLATPLFILFQIYLQLKTQ